MDFYQNGSLAALLSTMPPTPDQYLQRILEREAVPTGLASPLFSIQNILYPILQQWAGVYLLKVQPSGSISKGTANRNGTDVDLFISLSENTPESLSDIYNKLDKRMKEMGCVTRRQDVSVNVKVLGHSVDLVPGKRQNALSSDYSLYRRKADTWTKTNVDIHANYVGKSGRLGEIRILKLWRDQKRLEWPSFCLELAVIEALGTTRLGAAPYGTLADNMIRVFRYLRDRFAEANLCDPGNWSNVVSNDLTKAEKIAITNKAIEALMATNWRSIVV